MANKKKWVSKHLTLSSFDDALAVFFVEAKPNKKWIKVGGPFNDRGTAEDFAKEYSTEHPDVEVSVVVES